MGGGVHDSYTFQCGLVGSFTSPGIDTRLKGPTAFSVSSERHWQGGVNGIAKVPKRSYRSGIRTRPGNRPVAGPSQRSLGHRAPRRGRRTCANWSAGHVQLFHFHHCKRHLKKRTIALDPLPPPPPAYAVYARENDDNYGRPLTQVRSTQGWQVWSRSEVASAFK